MSEVKLLPCPFCGNEHPIVQFKSSVNLYQIHCPQCQSIFKKDCTAGNDTKKESLIKAWNTRKPIDDMVEQLLAASDCVTNDFAEELYKTIRTDKAIEIVRGGAECQN